jgi:hypothetical protein
LLVTKIVVIMGTDSDVRPHNSFSISDNQTSSHQCSLAMLVCSCIPLVCLNPSSVNLDMAVGLCGSLYTSPKPLRLLPSTYHRLMVCSPTLFALRLGHSLCVYSDNLSIQNTQGIHPLLHLLSPLVVCLNAFATDSLTASAKSTRTQQVWLLSFATNTAHSTNAFGYCACRIWSM